MNIPTIIVMFLITFYTIYCLKLILPNTRKGIQNTNKQLGTLRQKTYKTLEEQKTFLNIKYPKTIGTFSFSWKMIPKVVLHIAVFIIIFRGYMFLFNLYNVELRLWQALLFIILFPIIINVVLERFNVQKGDLRYLLRW